MKRVSNFTLFVVLGKNSENNHGFLILLTLLREVKTENWNEPWMASDQDVMIFDIGLNVAISDVLSANRALKIWVRARGVRASRTPSTAGR